MITKDGKIIIVDGKGLNFDSLVAQANEVTGKDDKTVKDAIQSLCDKINSSKIVKTTDILEYTIKPNTYISNINGTEISYNGWDSTDFIDINGYSFLTIYCSVNTSYCALYDSEKKFIRSISLYSGTISCDVEGCAYFRYSNARNGFTNLSIKGVKFEIKSI